MDEDTNPESILTEKLVSEALGGVEIISLESEPAVAKGEHYLSVLLRVKVTYRQRDKSKEEKTKIIVKTNPDSGLKHFSMETQLLAREIYCYDKILPVLSTILGRNVSPRRIGPLHSHVLILEDLQPEGFKMVDRVERMDFKHCEASVKILADLHAASIIAYEKDPSVFDGIKKENLYTDECFIQKNFVMNSFKYVADEFEKNPCLQKYCERIRNAAKKTWEATVDAIKPRSDEVMVFNHGDFWTTNILFRYDDQNKIENTKLVDYQFSKWTSPAFDLTMLYTTSLKNRQDIPKLTSTYLDRINQHFENNIITAKSLENSLKRFYYFGLLLAVSTLPICILDSKNPLNFQNVTKEDYLDGFEESKPNPYQQSCKDKKYQKIIPEFLDFYIENNIL